MVIRQVDHDHRRRLIGLVVSGVALATIDPRHRRGRARRRPRRAGLHAGAGAPARAPQRGAPGEPRPGDRPRHRPGPRLRPLKGIGAEDVAIVPLPRAEPRGRAGQRRRRPLGGPAVRRHPGDLGRLPGRGRAAGRPARAGRRPARSGSWSPWSAWLSSWPSRWACWPTWSPRWPRRGRPPDGSSTSSRPRRWWPMGDRAAPTVTSRPSRSTDVTAGPLRDVSFAVDAGPAGRGDERAAGGRGRADDAVARRDRPGAGRRQPGRRTADGPERSRRRAPSCWSPTTTSTCSRARLRSNLDPAGAARATTGSRRCSRRRPRSTS